MTSLGFPHPKNVFVCPVGTSIFTAVRVSACGKGAVGAWMQGGPYHAYHSFVGIFQKGNIGTLGIPGLHRDSKKEVGIPIGTLGS